MDFPPHPLEKVGYTLEFQDEFETGILDTSKWIPYYFPQWSSRAQAAPRYHFAESALVLEIAPDQAAWCPEFDGDVRCSSIQTGLFAGELGSSRGQHRFNPACRVREVQTTQRTYTPQYGYFETRMKVALGTTNLAALWLIGFEETPEDSGEITMFEVFGNQITNDSSEVRYGIKALHDTRLKQEFYQEVLPFDAREYHLYAIEWTPTQVDFYVDNVKRRTVQQSPHYPMQFMLNIYDLPMENTSSTPYPKEFMIDYFRGYQPIGGYR